jgi:Rod binding domain-containing protein
MYFGDEDPMLVASHRNALPDSEVINDPIQSQPMQQDHVLLFDDLSSSFSYSDGGGAADISSSVILSPANPARNMVCKTLASSTAM